MNQEPSRPCGIGLGLHIKFLVCTPRTRGWLVVQSLLFVNQHRVPHVHVGGWVALPGKPSRHQVYPTYTWVVGIPDGLYTVTLGVPHVYVGGWPIDKPPQSVV